MKNIEKATILEDIIVFYIDDFDLEVLPSVGMSMCVDDYDGSITFYKEVYDKNGDVVQEDENEISNKEARSILGEYFGKEIHGFLCDRGDYICPSTISLF